MKRIISTIIFLSLAATVSFPAAAQFTGSGTESPDLKWSSFSSPNFKLIFPEGLDSLARCYAASLEKFRVPNSMTSGFMANQFYKKPHPVVLHSQTAYSNGSVSWAPRNLSIYTNPESYGPEALNWVDMLSVHEGRHVVQMQLGASAPKFRIFKLLAGEVVDGVIAAIYSGPTFLEGDAVAAETALTESGRGRTADFLSYYRAAFAEGQYRDYWKWSMGSQRWYTPDYYRAGYMLHAGMRYTFDKADFTKYYYQRILRKPLYPTFNLQKSVKEVSGMKFRKAFRAIEESFEADWEANDSLRQELAGPFMEGKRIVDSTRYFRSFYGTAVLAGKVYAIRSGLDLVQELVQIEEDGNVRHLAYMNSRTSRLASSEATGKLYWTELSSDVRWEKKSYSRLWSFDPVTRKKAVLGEKYSRWYNPAASPGDSLLAVVENLPDSRTALVVLNARSGERISSVTAPGSLQLVEAAWLGGKLFVSAISKDGFGLYEADGWKEILRPESVKISRLYGWDGRLWFSSDRDGTSELYSVRPGGPLHQETNLHFGGGDWTFFGENLLFSSVSSNDNGLRALPAEKMLAMEVSPAPLPRPIPEKLSRQEDSLIAASGLVLDEITPENVSLTEEKPYIKSRHLFKVHSWAPIYVDDNVVSSSSFETIGEESSLGATVWFQNDLESSYGQVGLEWRGKGLPALHAQWVYRGMLPVIELRGTVGGRNALLEMYDYNIDGNSITFSPQIDTLPMTRLSGTARVYLPLRFNSGAWQRGIIPSLAAGVSNDYTPVMNYKQNAYTGDTDIIKGAATSLAFAAALRGYAMLPSVPSGFFPKLGAGMELSIVDRPLHRVWVPSKVNALLYGYLPGFFRTDGWRLELGAAHEFGGRWVDTDNCDASVEYAVPFAPVDWSFLSPLTYIRNFELHLYGSGSYSVATPVTGGSTSKEFDASVGAGIAVQLSNLAWLPFSSHIGLKYIYDPIHPEFSGLKAIFTVDN